ncbi:MAG: hypothetical protein H7A53_12245 [Akkermansiaceae bacterium]|nr:hypothetical protein [Akkermansiaceae bacterium]
MNDVILAQTVGPATDFVLTDYYEELSDFAFDTYELLTPFAYVLAFAGLLLQAYKVGFGDLTGAFGLIMRIGIVAVALPFFPDVVFAAQEYFGYTLLNELDIDPIAIVTDAVTDSTDDFMASFTEGGLLDQLLYFLSLEVIYDAIWNALSQTVFIIVGLVGWFCILLGFLVQIVGLYMGVALSPIFLGMFLFDNTREAGVKYLTGLFAMCLWPLGWALGLLVAKALITADLLSDVPIGLEHTATSLDGVVDLIVGLIALIWIVIVVFKAPKIISSAILTGSQIGAGLAQELLNTATTAVTTVATTTIGAAATVATAGAAAPAAAAAIGAGAAAASTGVSAAGGAAKINTDDN